MQRPAASKLTTAAACLLLALAAGCSPEQPDATAASATPPALDAGSRLAALEARVAQAEAIRSIKRVQRAYAQFLGAGRFDDAAALFSRTGNVILPDTLYAGDAGIRRFFADRFGATAGRQGLAPGQLNEQLILSPVVNLDADGTSAHGRWRLVALAGDYGNSADWEGGIFENTYVLEDDSWKIATIEYYPIYAGPYASGWRNIRDEAPEDVEPIAFHYDADGAGVPAPPVRVTAAVAEADLPSRLGALEARVARLADEDALISLQNAYGYYVDRMLWADAADLFTDDGTIELGLAGIYRGRARILEALRQFGPSPLPADRINDHLQLQPVVRLAADGSSARIRGTELQMLGRHGGEAAWGIAIYDNTFERQSDGRWAIASMHVYTRMHSDYEAGWAEDAQPPAAPSTGLPPDAPPSVDYAAYPDFFAPPFAFSGADVGSVRSELPTGRAPGATADRLDELERRVRQLNAYDGAENVANAYGYYIDEFLWDGMADLFAVDGWKELSYIGTYVGRERVRQSVVSRYGRGGRRANSMTFHQKVQPVITVGEDGTSAKIRTRLFQLNSSTASAGSYNAGIYENEIVLEDGVWKILAMDLDYQWTANYATGWHRVEAGTNTRNAPAQGSLTGEDAPDRPLRGVIYAPYPDAPVDMAFHYTNPVSGRAPPLLLDASVYLD